VTDSQAVNDIRNAVAALNDGQLNGYLEHFTPSSVRWVDGVETPFSLGDVGENLGHLISAFQGLHLEEELSFGTDRYVCAHWRMTGHHVSEYLGVPPTGHAIAVRTCEVYEFDSRQVATTWTHGDLRVLFRQIDGSSARDRPQ
jgi:predicted ester cyclase